jgi:hypothetical protein
MQKTIELTISNVPEVESVIQEIRTNAETTIKNFWDKEIRVVPEEKELEYKAKVDTFRLENDMIARIDTPIAVEPIEEVTETVKDDIITPLKAR